MIRQMLFELACSTLIAFLLSYFLIILVRPAFSGLLGIEIGVSQLILFFSGLQCRIMELDTACRCCCFLALKPFGYAVSVGKGG